MNSNVHPMTQIRSCPAPPSWSHDPHSTLPILPCPHGLSGHRICPRSLWLHPSEMNASPAPPRTRGPERSGGIEEGSVTPSRHTCGSQLHPEGHTDRDGESRLGWGQPHTIPDWPTTVSGPQLGSESRGVKVLGSSLGADPTRPCPSIRALLPGRFMSQPSVHSKQASTPTSSLSSVLCPKVGQTPPCVLSIVMAWLQHLATGPAQAKEGESTTAPCHGNGLLMPEACSQHGQSKFGPC